MLAREHVWALALENVRALPQLTGERSRARKRAGAGGGIRRRSRGDSRELVLVLAWDFLCSSPERSCGTSCRLSLGGSCETWRGHSRGDSGRHETTLARELVSVLTWELVGVSCGNSYGHSCSREHSCRHLRGNLCGLAGAHSSTRAATKRYQAYMLRSILNNSNNPIYTSLSYGN